MVIMVFTLAILGNLNATNIIPGGARIDDDVKMNFATNKLDVSGKFVTVSGDPVYATTTYTFADIVVFSYFDSTEYSLYNTLGIKIDSVKLGMNSYHVFSPGVGIYSIQGTKSFTLLIGDPISRSVMGFFAVDESGRPLSTNINTFMPKNYYSKEHFIVFAYSNNTGFQIKDLSSGSIIATGILNEGEHYQLDGYNNTFINVTSNKPISALSYTDQGYYIPATNGTFAGNHFFGFSGSVAGFRNGIIVTAYNDFTSFIIKNSTTNDTIAIDTLNAGEVFSRVVYADTYWEIIASNNCTVCNTPYAAYSSSYYYLTRQIDEDGLGIGNNFYTPVIPGNYNVFSYEDENIVTIVDQSDSSLVWSDTLNTGEEYSMNSLKKVYHVTSDKNISIISSWGGSYGADFMPLSFTTGLPDLAITEEYIVFTPDTVENEGDSIRIDATVYNYGYQTAYEVECQFFDGDPSGGNPISELLVTDSIPAGGNYTFSVDWIAPSRIKYHAVNVLVDPYDRIRESNSSNNLMFKYLIENDDLLPPFTTGIDAPKSINTHYGVLDTSQFEITVYMFNTGNVDATNSFANIFLPEGLSLVDIADTSVDVGTILAQKNESHTWLVHIDSLGTNDAFYYSVTVGADSIADKTLERMITVYNFVPKLLLEVSAPDSIKADHGDPDSSEFDITVDLFNSGGLDATNSFASLSLPAGLSLPDSVDTLANVGTIKSGKIVSYNWTVKIDSIYNQDAFYYSVTVGADSIENKTTEYKIGVDNFTSVNNEHSVMPNNYNLSQNYPNPFNPITNFEYSIPENAWVKISVFNIVGQKVTVLVNGYKSVGTYQMTFDANDLSSGIYYLQMQTNKFRSIRKMVYLK